MYPNSTYLVTVESSTFGVDMIKGLCYKHRMMGVPIEEVTKIYCDKSVVKSSTRPESTLKKKHDAITYHHGCVRGTGGGVHLWLHGLMARRICPML
jgi:hypothetical protein